VFAYLAAQNGRPVPRDELAEVLWGDELPATWEKALRVLMTKLRALLEECGIEGSAALTSAFGCYKLTKYDRRTNASPSAAPIPEARRSRSPPSAPASVSLRPHLLPLAGPSRAELVSAACDAERPSRRGGSRLRALLAGSSACNTVRFCATECRPRCSPGRREGADLQDGWSPPGAAPLLAPSKTGMNSGDRRAGTPGLRGHSHRWRDAGTRMSTWDRRSGIRGLPRRCRPRCYPRISPAQATSGGVRAKSVY
jgi:hypothetical protein